MLLQHGSYQVTQSAQFDYFLVKFSWLYYHCHGQFRLWLSAVFEAQQRNFWHLLIPFDYIDLILFVIKNNFFYIIWQFIISVVAWSMAVYDKMMQNYNSEFHNYWIFFFLSYKLTLPLEHIKRRGLYQPLEILLSCSFLWIVWQQQVVYPADWLLEPYFNFMFCAKKLIDILLKKYV